MKIVAPPRWWKVFTPQYWVMLYVCNKAADKIIADILASIEKNKKEVAPPL